MNEFREFAFRELCYQNILIIDEINSIRNESLGIQEKFMAIQNFDHFFLNVNDDGFLHVNCLPETIKAFQCTFDSILTINPTDIEKCEECLGQIHVETTAHLLDLTQKYICRKGIDPNSF
jgi:hypothetical protein